MSSNFDSLLLQGLMGKLQLRPPYLNTNSHLSQTLEDLLLDTNSLTNNYSDTDSDSDERTLLSKEESKLEKDIIKVILSGDIETLKPNSGQAVTVGEHHICVGFHQETDSDYRVWEWHGHIMLFDDEAGYTPEYIYGNYFERLVGKNAPEENKELKEVEEEKASLGLKELIDGAQTVTGRILRRNVNVASTRV